MPPGRLPVKCSGDVPLARDSGEDLGHTGKTVSWLAWHHLGIPLQELEEVAEEEQVLCTRPSSPKIELSNSAVFCGFNI